MTTPGSGWVWDPQKGWVNSGTPDGWQWTSNGGWQQSTPGAGSSPAVIPGSSAGMTPGGPGGPGTATPGPPIGGPGSFDIPTTVDGTDYANLANNDPEYRAIVARLEANIRNAKLENDERGVEIRTRYGNLAREAGNRLPQELQQGTDSAAGRGMLYSGGYLEQQGDTRNRFAEYNANIVNDQNSEINAMQRALLARQEEARGEQTQALGSTISRLAQEAAARRAAERAATPEAAPAAGGAPIPGVTGPVGVAPVASNDIPQRSPVNPDQSALPGGAGSPFRSPGRRTRAVGAVNRGIS